MNFSIGINHPRYILNMNHQLEHMRLRTAIDRCYSQYAGVYDELARMRPEGYLARKVEPGELKTVTEKLIERMAGPKQALQHLIRELDAISGAVNSLTKGTAPVDRSQAYGRRGELSDRVRRLRKEAEAELKAVTDWINKAHNYNKDAATTTASGLEQFKDIASQAKDLAQAKALLSSPSHDTIHGPTAPAPDIFGAIPLLIMLVGLLTRKSRSERKSLDAELT